MKTEGPLDPFGKGRSLLRFPLKRPIRYEGRNLGNLIVDFEPPDTDKRTAVRQRSLSILQGSILLELFALAPLFASDVELALSLRKRYLEGTGQKVKMALSYRYEKPLAPSWEFYLWAKDDILDLVREDGITPLRLFAAIAEFSRWCALPSTLNATLDELKAALIDFSLSPRKNASFPKGRPAKTLPRLIGKKAIREMSEDLTSFCQVLNKNWDGEYDPTTRSGLKDLCDLFDFSAKAYFTQLRRDYERSPKDEVIKRRLNRIACFEDEKQAYRPLLSCVLENNDLLEYINLGRFKPSQLASKFMDKLLGLTRSVRMDFLGSCRAQSGASKTANHVSAERDRKTSSL